MKPLQIVVLALVTLILSIKFSSAQLGLLVRPGISPKKPTVPKVMCTADSLMIYKDCLICVCPRPNRAARCYRKSCDLRTKNSGQCPPTYMRMDDNRLCPGAPVAGCRTDNDCPDKGICCFDFCKGNQCVNPVGLDPGTAVHKGLGYS